MKKKRKKDRKKERTRRTFLVHPSVPRAEPFFFRPPQSLARKRFQEQRGCVDKFMSSALRLSEKKQSLCKVA